MGDPEYGEARQQNHAICTEESVISDGLTMQCANIRLLRVRHGLVITGIMAALFFPAIAYAASCQGGSVTVCGVAIPLPPDMVSIGNRLDVHIPPSALGGAYSQNYNLYFAVECVSDDNGGVVFQPQGTDNIPCGLFPCQASSVMLCGTAVPVAGGTPIGGIAHLTMPEPFTRDGFIVECVANPGGLPVYQIINQAGVSCELMPSSP